MTITIRRDMRDRFVVLSDSASDEPNEIARRIRATCPLGSIASLVIKGDISEARWQSAMIAVRPYLCAGTYTQHMDAPLDSEWNQRNLDPAFPKLKDELY